MSTGPNNSQRLLERFSRLQARMLAERPSFKALIDQRGDSTIFQSTEGLFDLAPTPRLAPRRHVAIRVIEREVAQRLGPATARSVSEHLSRTPVINTTDHHAIIDHPFWVNTNLITSFPSPAHLVVLSFASVSQNTAAGYPRGIMFHGGSQGEGELVRLPILPDRTKTASTYGTPPITRPT